MFMDTACCGGLEQTATFEEGESPMPVKKQYLITHLETPSSTGGLSTEDPIDEIKDLLNLGLNKKSSIQIFPDTSLPSERLTKKESADVNEYISRMEASKIDHILEILLTTNEEKPGKIAKDRSYIWRSAFKFMQTKVLNMKESNDTAFFPSNCNFKQVLEESFRDNPLFASALSLNPNGETLELISFQSRDGHVPDNLYYRLMQALIGIKHKINVYFDQDLKIREIKMIDGNGNEQVADASDFEYYSSGVLYNLLFYATAVHVNLSVLQHVLASVLCKSTKHSNTMTEVMNMLVDKDTSVKYVEVAAMFLDANMGQMNFGDSKQKILSLLGGNSDVNAILRDQLLEWLKFKDTQMFVEKFVLKASYEKNSEDEITALIDKVQILGRYRKISNAIKEFDSELIAILTEEKASALEKTNAKIKSCMLKFESDTLESFSSIVQLWNISKCTQEASANFTRFSIVPEIMRWRNINQKYWEPLDVKVMNAVVISQIATFKSIHDNNETDKENEKDTVTNVKLERVSKVFAYYRNQM
ncbi:hypothetical protein CTEN210_06263 [Chaetoceros tenuissimus]|uniref:Uncharacterized protein n=1 Tax=Chaetoceros tenuissimus TaxID=426638 RepID=A0AAD3H404_9STRA|nr:hypothetical protein CTEN210_06263 [Chaetoceros tenuissimus]